MTDRVEEMAHVIWSKGGAGLLMYDALRIAEVLVAAGYERRPEHVHSWMTEFGHKQVCSVCRGRREMPRMSPEDAEAARAYFESLRKQVEG